MVSEVRFGQKSDDDDRNSGNFYAVKSIFPPGQLKIDRSRDESTRSNLLLLGQYLLIVLFTFSVFRRPKTRPLIIKPIHLAPTIDLNRLA